MLELTGKQKRHLRGLAHGLKPVAHIGKHGLTDAFLNQLDEALEHHELVKVKFVDFKDEKAEISRSITERLGCAEAGRVGHLLILFRHARQEEHRHIRLPKAQD